MLKYRTRNEDDYFEEADDTINGVLTFERTPRGTSGDVRKVQVIVTRKSPIDLILAGFHSSKPCAIPTGIIFIHCSPQRVS